MRPKKINLDITNKCSNACPACIRQVFYEGKNPPGKDISIGDMKKITFYFDEIFFCGQISDPLSHSKFEDILNCCKGKNVYIVTSISSRPLNYYVKLFKLSSKNNFKWIFGLDGMPKTNNKYRVNQDGIKLFEIMKLGAIMGCDITWSFIYFNFNENEVDECRKLAEKHGIKFQTVLSSRWWGDLEKLKPKDPNKYLQSLH